MVTWIAAKRTVPAAVSASRTSTSESGGSDSSSSSYGRLLLQPDRPVPTGQVLRLPVDERQEGLVLVGDVALQRGEEQILDRREAFSRRRVDAFSGQRPELLDLLLEVGLDAVVEPIALDDVRAAPAPSMPRPAIRSTETRMRVRTLVTMRSRPSGPGSLLGEDIRVIVSGGGGSGMSQA